MAFTEDQSIFFSTDDFGVAGTFGADTINGIFEDIHVETDNISGFKPTFLISADDVGKVSNGEVCTINGTGYVVRDINRTGDGLHLLILEES